jgi:undecaprenyl-diphosphatase
MRARVKPPQTDVSTAAEVGKSSLSGQPRGVKRAILLLMQLTVMLGLAVNSGAWQSWDRGLLRALALRDGHDSDALIAMFRSVSWLSDTAQRTAMVVIVASWLLWHSRRRAAIVILAVPVFAGVSNSLLKELFGRARPDIVPHLDQIGNLAYPSGHASNAMAFFVLTALLLARRHRAWWIGLAIAVSLLIGTSRLMLGVHWPSDVIGGWLWGLSFALGGWHLAREDGQRIGA